MAKDQKPSPKPTTAQLAPPRHRRGLWVLMIAALILGGAVILLTATNRGGTVPSTATNAAVAPSNTTAAKGSTTPAEMPTMNINQAVMVTVELDFGPKVPSIAEALREIERRSTPDDGRGRTFAILDAYGEPTPAGKLHISMHVSSEKPGVGAIIFRRTGEVLWQSRIVTTNSAAAPFSGKNLLILIDNGAGKTFTVDGSANPASVLDANVKELGVPVRVFWPDGAEREITCIYSACGCPVKVMVRREGERTVRTKDLPVMFPDDPAVVTVISRLMLWQ